MFFDQCLFYFSRVLSHRSNWYCRGVVQRVSLAQTRPVKKYELRAWAEDMSRSIPSLLITTQHKQPFRTQKDIAKILKNCKKIADRRWETLLPPGLEPETFASLNIQIEVLVRRSNQLSYGSRSAIVETRWREFTTGRLQHCESLVAGPQSWKNWPSMNTIVADGQNTVESSRICWTVGIEHVGSNLSRRRKQDKRI